MTLEEATAMLKGAGSLSARLSELERELAQARARIAELEEKLAAALEGTVTVAKANAERLREWNIELNAAGGEEGLLAPTKPPKV